MDLGLSITDLHDDRNQVDAEYELTRAEEADRQGDSSKLLAWARKWGRPAIDKVMGPRKHVDRRITPPRGRS